VKEYKIYCVVKNSSGIVTQLGFKDHGIHSIFIITRLVLSERILFYINENGNRVKVVVGESKIDNDFATSDEEIIDINELNFLPACID
jgi:hypothetical protein